MNVKFRSQLLIPFNRNAYSTFLIKIFYLPTDAKENCFKKNIKIYIKTGTTCFGAVTPSSGSAIFELAKVIVVKIIS